MDRVGSERQPEEEAGGDEDDRDPFDQDVPLNPQPELSERFENFIWDHALQPSRKTSFRARSARLWRERRCNRQLVVAKYGQNRVRGPWWGVQRGLCCFSGPLPAGGLARRKPPEKEHVSKRGHRVVCPLTNSRGLQSERCGGRGVLNAGTTKEGVRCVPRFLMGVPPAARGLRTP